MTIYRSMYKYELAAAAGVSRTTFRRWLLADREQLEHLGCSLNCHLLNPASVKFLCEKYVIDVL